MLKEAIYAAHASDHDSGANGLVTYTLERNPSDMFFIDEVRVRGEEGKVSVGVDR